MTEVSAGAGRHEEALRDRGRTAGRGTGDVQAEAAGAVVRGSEPDRQPEREADPAGEGEGAAADGAGRHEREAGPGADTPRQHGEESQAV